jgi:hypothetical protein
MFKPSVIQKEYQVGQTAITSVSYLLKGFLVSRNYGKVIDRSPVGTASSASTPLLNPPEQRSSRTRVVPPQLSLGKVPRLPNLRATRCLRDCVAHPSNTSHRNRGAGSRRFPHTKYISHPNSSETATCTSPS